MKLSKVGSLFAFVVVLGVTVPTTLWGQSARFAYVTNCGGTCSGSGSGNVSAYSIDGLTGSLTTVPGSPFAAGTSPHWVTIHST